MPTGKVPGAAHAGDCGVGLADVGRVLRPDDGYLSAICGQLTTRGVAADGMARVVTSRRRVGAEVDAAEEEIGVPGVAGLTQKSWEVLARAGSRACQELVEGADEQEPVRSMPARHQAVVVADAAEALGTGLLPAQLSIQSR